MPKYLSILLILIAACSSQSPSEQAQVKWQEGPVSFSHQELHGPLSQEQQQGIDAYCTKLQESFVRYGWGKSGCHTLSWLW